MSIAVGIALTTEPERSRTELDELCRCLSHALREPVTAHGMWHYHHLLEALQRRELDLVWLPPVLALRATAQGVCIPIALPVRHGVSTYGTALFTRAGSPVRDLDALDGVSAAWVDRQSAAGYLMIRAYLRSKGVDLERAFAHEVFLGTHDAVAGAVLDGDVDVGATFVHFGAEGAHGKPHRAGWGERDVHVIASADSIPSDIIAVNRKMSPGRRGRIQAAFVTRVHAGFARAAQKLMGADSFIAPSQAHLDALLAILPNLEETRGAAHTKFPPPRR